VEGKTGPALAFDGEKSFVDVPDSPSLRISGSLTIALWFKNGARVRDWSRLAGKAWNKNEPPFISYGIMLDNGPEGGQHVTFQNSENNLSGVRANSTTVMAPGQWHYVAVVYDADKAKAFVYVDGSKEGEAAAAASPLRASSGNFRIGDDWATHEGVKGSISDVRLYNRALSEAEIKALYESQSKAASKK
jgi:hypothetical protein